MRILVTGASGLFGINFAMQYCEVHAITGTYHQHKLFNVPFKVEQVDLTKTNSGIELVEKTQPELILHGAALANLDACDAHPALAQRLNAELPGELALAARQNGATLVHLSTDAVFDGQRGDYDEADAPNPINTYSRSKLAGERAVLEANPDAIVARVNFFGFSLGGQRSLGEFFLYNLLAGKQVNGFTDVFFCPLQVNQLAETLMRMVELDLKGLFHVVSSQALSKYEFGVRIARGFGLDVSLVQQVSWREGGLTATRSPNLTLKSGKLSRALGEALPDVSSGLKRFHEQFLTGIPQQLRNYSEID